MSVVVDSALRSSSNQLIRRLKHLSDPVSAHRNGKGLADTNIRLLPGFDACRTFLRDLDRQAVPADGLPEKTLMAVEKSIHMERKAPWPRPRLLVRVKTRRSLP